MHNLLRTDRSDVSLSFLQMERRLAEMQDIIRTEALQAKADADKDKSDMSRRLGSLHLAEATDQERSERIERQVLRILIQRKHKKLKVHCEELLSRKRGAHN
jgi:hypothetical protein